MSTISDAGLECALCHESYAVEIRTPRVLHGCGHTVCQMCCSALVDVNAPVAQVVCPFDRIVTLLTEPCIFSLKKNYALIEIIERHKKFTQSDQISSLLVDEVPPSEYMKDILLGIPCDEDPKHTAIFYCTVCESNMCSECSKRTHTGRVLSKHCRVPVSEKPLSRTMCPYHSAYAIEFVCQEVECLENNRLMCLLCRDYGRHRNHRHSLLEVEAAGLRERVREALSDFRSFISDLNGWNIRVTQTVTEIMDENEGSHVIARRQVEAHFRRLREELELQEQTAMSQLDAHVADRIEALRHHQQELAFITSQVTAVSAQLQESSEMDDARLIEQQTDLIKMLDAVRTHQSDIASAPSGLSLDTRIPFSFTADNRIHMGSNVDIRLVILGLDGAGKTTILYKLKSDEYRQSTTTVGFNVETIQYKNFKLTMWDVGGMPKLRRLWKHYFMNTQALVFVIDSSCPSRFGEAQNELAKIFAERELVDACFLVILNRRQPTTVSQHCVVSSAAIDQLVMNINRFSAGRTVMIHQCNAMTGIGLWEAVDALTSKLLLARNQTEILDVEDQSDEIGELEVEAETQTSDPYCN
ncbi:E3 ubiquitin-protein ligase [Dirofilaria immitis]